MSFYRSVALDIKVYHYPYRIELDGINQNGNVLFEYYFKNLENNTIEKKISYAKLFKDYNWIVATGVPISEITDSVKKIKDDSTSVIYTFYLSIFVCTLLLAYIGFCIITKIGSEYCKKVNQFVENETQKDMLTGCYNRKKGDELLNHSFVDFIDKGSEATILLLDIDNFKQINDVYGHDIGDNVLKGLVVEIEDIIGMSNKLIRWGGEEFVILLYDMQQQDYEPIVQKIISKASKVMFLGGDAQFSVTVSIGISVYDENDMSYHSVLKRADTALYDVKNSGRNNYKFFVKS